MQYFIPISCLEKDNELKRPSIFLFLTAIMFVSARNIGLLI